MKHTTILLVLAFAAGLAIVGCGGAAEESGKKVEEPKIEYPTAEAGGVTKIGIEGYFQIILADDTSGELRWLFKDPPNESLLKLVNESFDGPEGEEGGPGNRIWLFQAVSAGETELTIEFLRPWEEDTPPEKSETFKIVIEAAPAADEEQAAEEEPAE
jgi:predicted secreted protein